MKLSASFYVILSFFLVTFFSCAQKSSQSEDGLQLISNPDELRKLIDKSDKSLLLFDLYADWCAPCKVLSPTLASLASTYKGKASFYRVNVDRSPEIASLFGVQGIPHVVFVKGRETIHTLTGLQPKEKYETVIQKCGPNVSLEDCKNSLK